MLPIQRPGGAGVTDHTLLTNIGTNAHAQIDTHMAASAPAAHAAPKRCWVRHSANMATTNNTQAVQLFDTDNIDNDNMHYLSAANLTGTVAKTAASATLTGTGTLFTSELSVGQVITVPGTAIEKFVVIAIATNLSLTLNRVAANTASGQTATRVNSAIVFRTAGTYQIGGIQRFGNNATGYRQAALYLNNLVGINGTVLTNSKVAAVNGETTDWGLPSIFRDFAQWDYIEMIVVQSSGGALNTEAVPDAEPSMWATQI